MTWPQDAYVGQKVVCVDASPAARLSPCRLQHNKVYTIFSVYISKARPVVVFALEEYIGRDVEAWRASRFRPLVSTKTDISIFTAMLGPRQKETVDG